MDAAHVGMKWIECSITTTSVGVEHVESRLIKLGFSGWQVIDLVEMRAFLLDNPLHWDYIDENLFADMSEYATIKLYFEDDETGRAAIKSVETELSDLKRSTPDTDFGPLSISAIRVDDESWLDAWKEFFKPLEIGKSIVVRPAWEDYSSKDKLVVGIDPGYVFGTGQHETTRMCIEALEQLISPGDAMLDLGCGSGILSIVALALGAGKCMAVDLNPDAAGIVFQNAAINCIPDKKLTVIIGDIISDSTVSGLISGSKYDCIAANIVTDVIIPMMPLLSGLDILKPGGFLICSGIIKDRLDEVLQAAKGAGFSIMETMQAGEWASVICRKA